MDYRWAIIELEEAEEELKKKQQKINELEEQLDDNSINELFEEMEEEE